MTTATDASAGSSTTPTNCSRYGSHRMHCSAPTDSGLALTTSVHPITFAYAFVLPARNTRRLPTACRNPSVMRSTMDASERPDPLRIATRTSTANSRDTVASRNSHDAPLSQHTSHASPNRA